ncbi:hypothetical protein SAMN04487895_11726 [Paenibacillus sophorae]|uniref:ABC-three component systems C-terminal domain-containing protein n=1 Tax=Paenibacillus sophorae TaxID=1333845 RepID=A0A1H8UCJ5_9BACL|nr:ABC-three component system protein [Paenibacillus sophorae]QWU13192.1 hypothetical protein KP014_14300 [Paenibacillus sophorae]SEP00826.1 hypothetical protein SAMN04487895_11726 [Paenibacillus sophorae]
MVRTKKESPKEEINLANTHVPDKVYAYTLQVKHALYELQKCSGNDVVSVEVLEDVAVEKSDGTVKAIQVKNVSSKNNPISNRAKDLWKTFSNWLLAVNSKELDINSTKFVLFVTADRNGSIVSSFSKSTTIEESQQVWSEARKEFYDEFGKEKELAEDYAYYVKHFFNPETQTLASEIIKNFHLETININHTNLLYEKFCERAMVEEELGDTLFLYMLGWIEKKVSELVENKKPMCIAYQEYKKQLMAIRREFNQNLSLKELAPRPTEQEVQNEMNALRTYLEQLDVVECDYTEKIEAINDYLRASTNRTIWAKRGDISDGSLASYQETLIKKWNTIRKIIPLQYKSQNLSPEELGKLLYLQCKDERINIDHLFVPDFFTAGCFHALSDDITIGWHPNYKDIFMSGSGSNAQLK